MFKKKKAQKAHEAIMQEMEQSKSAISQIVDNYQEFEIFNAENIGQKVDFNYARTYIYMLSGYAEDIVTLINNERYSSLYCLLKNFLECYGLGKNLVLAYFDNGEEYGKLLKQYYAATLNQRKQECLDFNEDLAINYEEEMKFYDIRMEQMEKIICEFFDEYEDNLEGEDKEIALYEVIEKIVAEMNLPLDVDALALKALKSNELFTDEEFKRAVNIYISAKSASLNNVQTVLTRVLGLIEGRPALLVNKNEGIGPRVLDIVEKCLRDITGTVMEGFRF